MDDQTDEQPSGDPTERVRIIGADEAAEAIERGEIASRRSDRDLRYGDRPPMPPVGPRPALRFPLDPSADPGTMQRPPVRPRPSHAAEQRPGDPFAPRDEEADEPSPADEDREDAAVDPPELSGQDAAGEDDPYAPRSEPVDEAEPATIDLTREQDPYGPRRDEDGEDLDAWSSFAGTSPRWRDASDRHPSEDPVDGLEWSDEEPEVDEEEVDLSFAEEPEEDSVVGGAGHSRSNWLRRANPGHGRDLATATTVGIGFGVTAIVLLALGAKFALALVVVVVGVAAAEFYNTARRSGYQPATLFGLVATTALPLAVYWQGLAAVPVVLALAAMFGLTWYLVGAEGEARVVEGLGVTLLGVGWIGVLGSFAALLLSFERGRGMLVAAVVATVLHDVGSFVVGRNAHSRPLHPASPAKTVAGLIGGTVCCVVGTILIVGFVPSFFPFDDFGAAALLGLAVAIAAPLGDLCESAIKRDLGVKDMGSILPEHGGLLDRFDALLFVLPTTYFVMVLFDLGPFG